MNEVASDLQWLTAILSADSALLSAAPGGIRRGLAPVKTPTPYILLSHQGGSDVLSGTALRLMTSELFQVVAIGPTSQFPALVTCANRLDTLLGRTSQSAGGITILACYREQEIALDELVNGISWSRLGGIHRILR